MQIHRWKRHTTKTLLHDRWLHLSADKCETSAGVILDPYYVMHESDWVHVVAQDSDGKLIIVRQYRYAADTMCLELPGGVIDQGETWLEAARRELLEETGYTAAQWSHVGWTHANPARQTNKVHLFLAQQLMQAGAQQLEESEDITYSLMTREEIEAAIHGGEFSQALHIASYFKFLVHLGL